MISKYGGKSCRHHRCLIADAFRLMFRQYLMVGIFEDFPRVDRFHIGTVGDQNILAAFHRCLVLDDAVLWNAHAVKPDRKSVV